MATNPQFKVVWKPSPNFTKGRRGRKAIAIVNHITAGRYPGCLSWMCNQKAQASAHYLVTKLGDIYQLVKDEDSSWHAGAVNKPNWRLHDGSNPNYYTIGIEHEALSGERLTELQYQATLWLHKQLIARHGIPIDEDHIIGHYRIDSVNRPNCPGPGFPWQRLLNDLKGSDNNMLINVKAQVDLPEVPVRVNGSIIGRGVIIEDVTYMPVRAIAEALGAKVDWDANTRTVLISKGGK